MQWVSFTSTLNWIGLYMFSTSGQGKILSRFYEKIVMFRALSKLPTLLAQCFVSTINVPAGKVSVKCLSPGHSTLVIMMLERSTIGSIDDDQFIWNLGHCNQTGQFIKRVSLSSVFQC